jgi:hypothetical protein
VDPDTPVVQCFSVSCHLDRNSLVNADMPLMLHLASELPFCRNQKDSMNILA